MKKKGLESVGPMGITELASIPLTPLEREDQEPNFAGKNYFLFFGSHVSLNYRGISSD